MKRTIQVIALLFVVAGAAVFVSSELTGAEAFQCCVKCANGADCKPCSDGCLTGCSALGNPGIKCY